ncbi:macrolide phosphotransferase [Larkinella arboricola]|uniref:Macrolide phosphotransferase n=1 Tax=Larkinella arboricola TaxID=643671 RepID=A0A327WQR7_LARAB|nr:macrolide phosphotransferase [Larkinella arboricola]
METKAILQLAERHGLQLKDEISFNEMGIDFKVGFATEINGTKWVLRIPRRDNLAGQIEKERNILNLAKKYLSVAVPDWKIASPELVAYPLLDNKPVLTFDAQTYEVSWNMDQENNQYTHSLANVLVTLHQIPVQKVKDAGLKVLSPQMLRPEIQERLETVKAG